MIQSVKMAQANLYRLKFPLTDPGFDLRNDSRKMELDLRDFLFALRQVQLANLFQENQTLFVVFGTHFIIFEGDGFGIVCVAFEPGFLGEGGTLLECIFFLK